MANLKLTAEKLVKEKASVKTDLEMAVKWGCDLQSEHERYLTEEAFSGCPVIVRDYPKEIKAFYMRQNDDGKTVVAMDMLVPRVIRRNHFMCPLNSFLLESLSVEAREKRGLNILENWLDELKAE
ncbi:asparagine--tRNA ligase, chloroplastic/mitochondrial isoform X1 [Rosa chinensis]|uniref:asparagine--tRNA ligase, chloroplastic/mitochondrial isoform X1 n=1 Tax=Rosa chinensis TaxID=74649 RepID=UPI001AD9034E|nr:asparagine--tRNA ligase, chloroplastic/mitochondrial isoform X1 [Rosa chinensis]XP_040367652.1 asparagine--tRNA ligase, chloroplastic/mitochondrial isoform X1 [Rosa chinensis]